MTALLDHLPVVDDFPRPGVRFRDIGPLLADPAAFGQAIDGLAALAREARCELLVGVESRGLIFAAALALRLECGFTLLRKPGKLPPPVLRERYALEYGSDALELQPARIRAGQRVLLVDDVVATGGTLLAGSRLVAQAGGVVAGAIALLEIAFFEGCAKLAAHGLPARTLLRA